MGAGDDPVLRREYLRKNKRVYDELAGSSNSYYAGRVGFYLKLLSPFEKVLASEFGAAAKVLDLGCGTGPALRVLADNGFSAYGVDFSPKRAALARRNVPQANVVVGDFLSKRFDKRFQGVIMISSFHLFPSADVPLVLKRLSSLLVPGGYCLISIGENSLPKGTDRDEGYFPKTTAPDKVRFMTRYTRKGFRRVFKGLRWGDATRFYTLLDEDSEMPHVTMWMCVIIRKRGRT